MRFFVTAVTALTVLGAAASAEPPKAAPKQPASQPDSEPRPAQILLASADPVRAGAETPPAPVKRRIAPRVTACRCGDPQATPEPDGQ